MKYYRYVTKSLKGLLVPLSFFVPFIVYAGALATPRFDTVIDNYIGGFRLAGGMFLAIAVFVVIVGIVRYFNAGDNPERRSDAVQLLTWGVITVFVMLTFWGLVNILLATFFTPQETGSFQLTNRLWTISH